MIIMPMLPLPPSPSSSDCMKLLSYTNSLMDGLECVLGRLYEVSASPDEAIVLIRNKVETMLSETKVMRANLISINGEAVNMLDERNKGIT